MSTSLLLGPVLFDSFELPERIVWGGRQRLSVHLLPGGTRIIDAMGRDDAVITWSGVFSGSEGVARARLLDVLRSEGGVWPLTWDTFFYSVVIAEFRAEFTRVNWIPYCVTCTVLRDELEQLAEDALDLTANLLGDLAAAASNGLDVSAPLTALSANGATTSGTATNAAAGETLSASLASTDPGILATPATPTDTASLLQAADTSGQAAQTALARGYLQRAQANLLNAGT